MISTRWRCPAVRIGDAGVRVDVEAVVLADLAAPGPGPRDGSSRAGSPSTTFSQTVKAPPG